MTSARPYFRFGDGRWGRALYKLHVCSDVSGTQRRFSLYALPNPAEYYKSNFDKNMLVPILIGMDFLERQGNGMVIDFTTGLATSTLEECPEVVHLNQNRKGHFMLDVCFYLTRACTRQEGHAHVVVLPDGVSMEPTSEVHVLELHPVMFDLAAGEAELEARELEQSRQHVLNLHRLSREQQGLPVTASFAQMGNTTARQAPTSTSPSCSLHGDASSSPLGLRGGYAAASVAAGQGQGESQSPRLQPGNEEGSSRPPFASTPVALHGRTCSRSGQGQPARPVGDVPSLCSSASVHTELRLRRTGHSMPESRDGSQMPSGTSQAPRGSEAYGSLGVCDAASHRCGRGSPSSSTRSPATDAVVKTAGQVNKSLTEDQGYPVEQLVTGSPGESSNASWQMTQEPPMNSATLEEAYGALDRQH